MTLQSFGSFLPRLEASPTSAAVFGVICPRCNAFERSEPKAPSAVVLILRRCFCSTATGRGMSMLRWGVDCMAA